MTGKLYPFKCISVVSTAFRSNPSRSSEEQLGSGAGELLAQLRVVGMVVKPQSTKDSFLKQPSLGFLWSLLGSGRHEPFLRWKRCTCTTLEVDWGSWILPAM